MQYPLRVVVDAEAYADADTKIYGKVKALSRNRCCTASVEAIAEYAGVAPSTAEKSLRRLSRPAPSDGVAELGRRQRSHKGSGTGRTNERWCRNLAAGERYVWAPVLAADTLRGTLHRLYLFLRYADVVEKRQLTLAEMAWVLRHNSGKRKGLPLAEAAVSRLLDELAGLGWITLERRAGHRGRHLITVHDDPIRSVDAPPSTPDPEGGAGPDLEGGAPAYKEDQELDDPGNHPPTPVLGIRRRRPTATSARERDAVTDTFGRRTGLDLTPAAWHTVHHVLDPVRHRLPELTAWEWSRLVGTVLAQLRDGQTPDRLHQRLQRRYAVMWTPTTPDGSDGSPGIRSISRWLIGPALTRQGCERPDCETGTLWPDGVDCPTCALRHEHPAPPPQPATAPHRRPQARPWPAPAPLPAPPPPAADARIGPPPDTGGWRALVARERPHDLQAFRARWTGHQHLLPPDTPTGT